VLKDEEHRGCPYFAGESADGMNIHPNGDVLLCCHQFSPDFGPVFGNVFEESIFDVWTDPEFVAADLLSQAEHDEEARALLICPEARYLDDVQAAMERLLPDMERSDIIRASLARRGAMICVRDLAEAADVVNRIAPEHLELSVVEPERLAASIQHAGAIFMGRYTPEAFGDYCAGPSHVLPTSRTARFASPLGVYDFCKTTSLVQCTAEGATVLGPIAARLARCEGLTAHARSAELRYRD